LKLYIVLAGLGEQQFYWEGVHYHHPPQFPQLKAVKFFFAAKHIGDHIAIIHVVIVDDNLTP
jgi:hypothetical protein